MLELRSSLLVLLENSYELSFVDMFLLCNKHLRVFFNVRKCLYRCGCGRRRRLAQNVVESELEPPLGFFLPRYLWLRELLTTLGVKDKLT